MIVSIHQPNYLPWLGFFDKIKRSDLFVIFDDVQFPRGKKHFGHRNQIKTPNGTKWLSVPIKNKSDMVSFNDTIINYDIDWHHEHLRLMELNYKDSPYFNDYYQDLEYIIEGEYESLTELSTDLIRYFMSKLNIRTTIARSSELSSEYQKGPHARDTLERRYTKHAPVIRCRDTSVTGIISQVRDAFYFQY